MDLIISFIIGVLQGIFEWIPISSQGVISLFLTAIGYDFLEAVDIALFLHLGTALATISYFKKDVAGIINPKNEKDSNLLRFIIISTFFSLLIGGPVYLFLNSESLNFSSVNLFIGLMLLITGTLQGIKKNFKFRKTDSKISFTDSLVSGGAQGLSVIPGISRSGTTMFSLLLRGFNPEYCIKLSFLMSIPVVLIESVYQAVFKGFGFQIEYLFAAFVAFVVGRATISFFLKYVKKINFSIFCIILGVLSIVSAIF